MPEIVQLYDKDTIDDLVFPCDEEGEKIKSILTPLIKKGVKHYIDNVETSLFALKIDNLILPVTVNSEEYQNSYVCSPYGQYVLYALECIDKIDNKWLKAPLKTLVAGLGKLLKIGKVNRVVIVNNWLFSTNLHPSLSEKQIRKIRDFFVQRFPDHAVFFRSIHTYQNKDLYNALKQQRFDLLASRQVFFLNTQCEKVFNSRILKSDLKMLKESPYKQVHNKEISEKEAQTLANLYSSIYISRHSSLNPKLNKYFMQLAMETNLLTFKGLKKNDALVAFSGYFFKDGVMTSPLLGYDLKHSSEKSLYRLISTSVTLEAKTKGALYHMSSGASFYKTIRKAENNIEYHGVYCKHLPFYRKLPWIALKMVANSVGIPFMRYYNK